LLFHSHLLEAAPLASSTSGKHLRRASGVDAESTKTLPMESPADRASKLSTAGVVASLRQAGEDRSTSKQLDRKAVAGTYEAEVSQKINITWKQYFLPARFPIPRIPVYIEDSKRGCILGGDSCRALAKGKAWWPDPHVRDILSSVLLPCMFKKEPCLAIDIGANFGFHALSMLQFNTKITTIEPQPDMCASLMASVQRNGWSHLATIRCGAIIKAGSRAKMTNFHPEYAHHYGKVKQSFTFKKYNMKQGVPVIALTDLLPREGQGDVVRLLKVDTDSFDCDILGQILALVKKKRTEVRNMVTEGTGCHQATMAAHLYDAQSLNFTVYRTLLWEAQFDEDGSAPKILKHRKPEFIDEVTGLHFNRYLWRFHNNMTLEQWNSKQIRRKWQYFLSKDVLHSNELHITERT